MADESESDAPIELPNVADLNKIAASCAKAAEAMPTALAIDEIKGLAEPMAKKVAEEAVKKCCGGASDYLKKVKPEIQEDLEKAAKKCCGGCCKSTKEKIKRKGGSCGGVRSSACSTSTAAAPGFCPGDTVSIYAQIQAAKSVAKGALEAATATLGAIPSIVTTAEGTPATPTIAQALAVCGELITALGSLIATQDALLKNFKF